MISQTYSTALCPGEKVAIIAPGMAFDAKELKQSVRVMTSWGLDVQIPKGMLGAHPVSANSEHARWQQLESALKSDARVLWAARGGYGSIHLLKYLMKMRAPRKQKILLGFSDITSLHQFVNDQWGWSSLHGPHADRLYALNSQRQQELYDVLFAKKTELVFSLKPLNFPAQKKSKISAQIVGGNMITTQSTFGTRWQLRTQNRILFLEDIGERGYKVDRVLEHMWSLRLLQKAQAIIFGPFVGGEEPGGKRSKVRDVLRHFANKLQCPVFTGIDSGHIPNSRVLPFLTNAKIENNKIFVSTGISL